MKPITEIMLPIYLPSVSNLREHWSAKHKRQKAHENALICLFPLSERNDLKSAGLPIRVKLIRASMRKLDYGNLVSAFKHLQDCVADILIPGLARGRADGDDRIKWEYNQIKSSEKFVLIEFWKD